MASFGKIILDYGDYLIRGSEMDILTGEKWLNDVIIGFYMEYLRREIFPEDKTKMKFVSPEMTQLLKLCSLEDLPNLLGDLNEYDFVFFPINNFDDPDQSGVGGTHWSLLVYSKPENILAHYDSSYGMNIQAAETFSRQISQCLTTSPKFSPRGCEAQQNGTDCGLHVLGNMEGLATYANTTRCLNGAHTAKPAAASRLRARIIELIFRLGNLTKSGDH